MSQLETCGLLLVACSLRPEMFIEGQQLVPVYFFRHIAHHNVNRIHARRKSVACIPNSSIITNCNRSRYLYLLLIAPYTNL